MIPYLYGKVNRKTKYFLDFNVIHKNSIHILYIVISVYHYKAMFVLFSDGMFP